MALQKWILLTTAMGMIAIVVKEHFSCSNSVMRCFTTTEKEASVTCYRLQYELLESKCTRIKDGK